MFTNGFKKPFYNRRNGKNISNTWTPIVLLPKLWLRADLGITLNGTTVSAWADQSGNNNNVVQSDSTKQPVFEQIGFNGKPSIKFDGSNDNLQTSVAVDNSAQNKLSAFIVVQVLTNADGYPFSTDTSYSTLFFGLGVGLLAAPTSARVFLTDTKGNVGISLCTNSTTSAYNANKNYFIISADRSLTTAEAGMIFNGTTITNGTTLNANNTNNFGNTKINIGSATGVSIFSNCRIAEFALFQKILSVNEITSLNNYARQRYGLL